MQIYRTTWGLIGPECQWSNLTSFVHDAAIEGYDGVEFALANLAFQSDEAQSAITQVKEALSIADMRVIPLIATRPKDWGSVVGHLADFKRQVALAHALGASKAAVHCGSDSFDHATAVAFIRDCIQIAADLGIRACIETHRGRPLNDPWRTAKLLDALPDMMLTSDLSHWHVVVDRQPHDIMDLFDEASRRTGHLHARVGHEKGAQVPHPADPIWTEHLELYQRWWTISFSIAKKRGETLTVTPEFGPPPYMNMRPFTHERDADIIELNAWMREKLKEWLSP